MGLRKIYDTSTFFEGARKEKGIQKGDLPEQFFSSHPSIIYMIVFRERRLFFSIYATWRRERQNL